MIGDARGLLAGPKHPLPVQDRMSNATVMTQPEAARREALRLRQAGDRVGAAAICAQILERWPDDAGTLQLLGRMAFEAGSPEAALELLARAVAQAPTVASYWLQLGCVLRSQKRLEEALLCFQQAAALEPGMAEAHNNVGNALRELGRAQEALGPLRRALELRPSFPEAALNLAAALDELGRTEEAAACLESLLDGQPEFAEARSNLAGILSKMDRFEEALRQLELAVRQKPQLAAAWNNLGATQERLGRIEQAIACYRQAIALAPDFAEAHLNLGMALLLIGHFREGWEHYEWRLKQQGLRWERYRRPLWDGSNATGRKILLVVEQGLGDTIQFVRFVPRLAERGAVVYLECPWRLTPLLRSVPGLARLIPAGTVLPDYDAFLPLMSLPGRLGTQLHDIPAQTPYLAVPQHVVARWRAWLDREARGLRVGLCWASNAHSKTARRRSLSLGQLVEALSVPGITFFSLQRGPQAAEIGTLPPGVRVVDLEAHATGILDTAAAIMGLNLIISVDTMVAHLAGALARPVWTLLPYAPDFRWLLGRKDSPWYPTMRLFRQPAPGDWAGAIRELGRELELWRDSQEAKGNAQCG